jgi:type IV secretory pathway TraG/TraD family ATPase VirD4
MLSSLNAGYGVKIIAVVQHLGQLKQHYEENWETFLSGGLIVTFAPRDVMTSAHLSQLSGQEWINVSGSSVNDEGGGSVSLNQQLAPSIMPHEFRRMPRGMMIAFIPTDQGQVMRRIMAHDATELTNMVPQRVRDLMK